MCCSVCQIIKRILNSYCDWDITDYTLFPSQSSLAIFCALRYLTGMDVLGNDFWGQEYKNVMVVSQYIYMHSLVGLQP